MVNIIIGVFFLLVGFFNLFIGVWEVAQDKKEETWFMSDIPSGKYDIKVTENNIDICQGDKVWKTYLKFPMVNLNENKQRR